MICGHRKVATFSKQQEMFPAEKAGQSEIMLDKENKIKRILEEELQRYISIINK